MGKQAEEDTGSKCLIAKIVLHTSIDAQNRCPGHVASFTYRTGVEPGAAVTDAAKATKRFFSKVQLTDNPVHRERFLLADYTVIETSRSDDGTVVCDFYWPMRFVDSAHSFYVSMSTLGGYLDFIVTND